MSIVCINLIEYSTTIHSVAFRRTKNVFDKEISILEYFSTIIYHVLKTSEFAFGWLWRQTVVVGLSFMSNNIPKALN